MHHIYCHHLSLFGIVMHVYHCLLNAVHYSTTMYIVERQLLCHSYVVFVDCDAPVICIIS
jgi:hypothetical protein